MFKSRLVVGCRGDDQSALDELEVGVAVLRRLPPPGTTCPPLWTIAGKFSGRWRETVGFVGPTRRVRRDKFPHARRATDLIVHTGPSQPLNIRTSCTSTQKSINNRRPGDRVQYLHFKLTLSRYAFHPQHLDSRRDLQWPWTRRERRRWRRSARSCARTSRAGSTGGTASTARSPRGATSRRLLI